MSLISSCVMPPPPRPVLRHAAVHRPQVIDRTIAGNGQNPRPQRSLLVIEAVHPIPHPQKRFLYKVLGHSLVANHTKDQSEGYAAIAVVQLRHGLGIAV